MDTTCSLCSALELCSRRAMSIRTRGVLCVQRRSTPRTHGEIDMIQTKSAMYCDDSR